MKRLYQFIVVGFFFVFASSVLFETRSAELLVKYPPMTKEEMVKMAEDAAAFFAQEIKNHFRDYSSAKRTSQTMKQACYDWRSRRPQYVAQPYS